MSERTFVYLVRHGETIWNAGGRFQGQLDSPLNELGIRQAEALAKRLRHIDFTAIYTSDLGRAAQTAEILALPHRLPPVPDTRLRERCFGAFEGLTLAEAEEKFPAEVEMFRNDGYNFVAPGGETGPEIIQRAVECLTELALRHNGEQILVVTHGGIINRFIKFVMGIGDVNRRIFRVRNASINKFLFRNNDWEIETLGDTGHFEMYHDGVEE